MAMRKTRHAELVSASLTCHAEFISASECAFFPAVAEWHGAKTDSFQIPKQVRDDSSKK